MANQIPLVFSGGSYRQLPTGDTLVANAGAVVNDGGGSNDFRVRSSQRTHELYVDGASGRVAFGTDTPASHGLHLYRNDNGTRGLVLENVNAGTAAASELHFISDAGKAHIKTTSAAYVSGFQGVPADGLSIYSDVNLSGGIAVSTQHASAPIYFYQGGQSSTRERLRIESGAVTVNGAAQDVDFRVAASGVTYALASDGATGKIGIGLFPTASQVLDVLGGARLDASSTGTAPLLVRGTASHVTDLVQVYTESGGTKVFSVHPGGYATFLNTRVDITSNNSNMLALKHTDASATNDAQTMVRIARTTAGDMASGFGARVAFQIQDDLSSLNTIALINGTRGASDTEGQLTFYTGAAGSVQLLTLKNTEVVINEGGADVDTRIEAVGNANALFVQGSDGKVGVGIADPQAKRLHVSNDGTTPHSSMVNATSDIFLGTNSGSAAFMRISTASAANNDNAGLVLLRANGTISSPTAVVSGNYLGSIVFGGHDGTNRQSAATIRAVVDNTVAAGKVPAGFRFITYPTSGGVEVERVRITSAGEFWINELASSSTPSTGFGSIYPKTDGKLYFKNDGGTEYDLTAATGGITGSGTAGRVAYFTGANAIASESSAEFVWDATNNRLGLGTASPSGAIHVVSTGAGPYIDRYSTSPAHMLLRSAQGTVGAPTALSSGNAVGYLTFAGWDGSAFGEGPRIDAVTTQTWTGAVHGALMRFRIVRNGTTTQVNVLDLESDEAVFNQGGLSYGFRVEAAGVPSALTVDGASGLVSTGAGLTVTGVMTLTEQAAPSTPATGFGAVYPKTDGKLYFKNDGGTEYDLTAGAGAGDVTKVGTPVNNQLGVWTGDGTIEGDANLTWDGSDLTVAGDLVIGANGQQIRSASVATTDATPTTLETVATASDTTYFVRTEVVARRTGGASGTANDGAMFVRTARVKNNAGTVTVEDLQTDYTSKDQASWNATVTVSGTNAIVQVTGAASNNVSWLATTTIQAV